MYNVFFPSRKIIEKITDGREEMGSRVKKRASGQVTQNRRQ